MAHQCIKYRLNSDGTIPDFIYFGDDGMHGYYGTYPTGDAAEPSPRDLVQVGISVDNATGDFETIASQADLQAYLTTTSENDGWATLSPTEEDPHATVPFDPAAEAARVWGILNALNG